MTHFLILKIDQEQFYFQNTVETLIPRTKSINFTKKANNILRTRPPYNTNKNTNQES